MCPKHVDCTFSSLGGGGGVLDESLGILFNISKKKHVGYPLKSPGLGDSIGYDFLEH